MAIEIEIKTWVKDKKAFESKLRKFGAKFVHEGRQTDFYYNSPAKNLAKLEPPEYLRVREKDGKAVLAYHVVRAENNADEYETKCGEPAMVHKILKHLGCRILGKIDKHRKKYQISYKGETVNICVDDVEAVGEMAEFEIMKDKPEEASSAEHLIKELMDKFGLTEEDRKIPRLSNIATGRVKWPPK